MMMEVRIDVLKYVRNMPEKTIGLRFFIKLMVGFPLREIMDWTDVRGSILLLWTVMIGSHQILSRHYGGI